MDKKIFCLLACLLVLTTYGQKNKQKQEKKAQDAYNDAMLQLRDGFIKDAIPLLGKAIEYNPDFTDAYLSLAGVYGELKDYQKAVSYYETVKKKDSAYFRYYNLPYSIDLAAMGHFDEALVAVNEFLSIPNLGEKSIKSGQYRKNCYAFAIDYAQKNKNNDYVFTPQNLGDSINSRNRNIILLLQSMTAYLFLHGAEKASGKILCKA